MGSKSGLIICTACGKEAFVKREPRYDGFVKTGETYVCTACGHRYQEEQDVPFKCQAKGSVFTDADKPKKIQVFEESEKGHNCHRCRHYVINPFAQRCGLHNKLVEATDTCSDFSAKPKEDAAPGSAADAPPHKRMPWEEDS